MNFELVLKTALANLRYGRKGLIRFEDAIALTRDWCSRLPMKYDLLVGIPRSGLIFANFMSNELSIPLSIPEMLPFYWPARSENTYSWSSMTRGPVKSILVVEDMTTYGTRILPVREKTKELFPGAIVHIGAVYSPVEGIVLDSYGTKLDGTSITEWDFLEERTYQNVAVDLDGVLCQECPPYATEEEYVRWMETAVPYLIPSYHIHSVITSRREKYRAITENWLRHNKVKYYRLFMDPSSNDSERDLVGWKVYCINQRKPEIFIESSDRMAQEIHWRTSIPVICSTSMRMYVA